MIRGLALHKICKKKILLVSCQHGITREIIYDPDLRSIFFETSFSDYFCYNDMSKKVTKNSSYASKIIYTIGLPSDYKNFNLKILEKKNLLCIYYLIIWWNTKFNCS